MMSAPADAAQPDAAPPAPSAPPAVASPPWWAQLPRRDELRPFFLSARQRLLAYSRKVQPPPPEGDHVANALYGAAQPLLGIRVLLKDAELLREAFVPAGWLALFCGLVALTKVHHFRDAHDAWRFAKTFYKTFGALAIAPPILFANHYARLAAQVRWRLGFGACGPREASLWFFAKRALQGVVLVALAAGPVYLLEEVPVVNFLAPVLLGLWGLQWVVVDAFDDARVLMPGETLESAEATGAAAAPAPWFVRAFYRATARLAEMPRVPRFLVRLGGWFARTCDRLSVPWREEIALIEKHRALGLGFALSTTTLLATPVLNLLFRPIIIVAASHLLGHLESSEAGHGHPAASEGALPAPASETAPG